MKANKFLRDENDEAVSPVIAVILMVAITVVLAATVYVWVSGFGTSGSIKKFPQVTLKDDGTDNSDAGAIAGTFDDNDALAVLEHRGGDTITWADYTVKIFRAGTEVTSATATNGYKFDTAQACSAAATATAPTGTFAVGNKLYLCTNNAAPVWTENDELKVQIIDENQNSIVYENTIVVT